MTEEQAQVDEEQSVGEVDQPDPVSARPVLEYTGPYIPSALQAHLYAVGVPCLGVTYTDETDGIFTVQVICDEGTTQADVDAAVQTYTPPTD